MVRRAFALAGLLLAVPAAAGAVTIGGSWGVSGSALSGPGLEVMTTPASTSFSLNLHDGQAASLDLFRIWTRETDIGSDDLVSRGLSVGFDVAGFGSGAVAGTTVGHRGGPLQWGSVDWSAPLSLDLGAGTLSISLEDAVFNAGAFRLSNGQRWGSDVRATFMYTSPVPLPAGLGLLLAGLAALGLVGRRRAQVPRPA